MHARIAAFTVLALAASACSREPVLETRTFELRHLEVRDALGLLDPYVYSDRPGAAGQISIVSGLVTVRDTRDNLDRIARVLEEYDRPAPGVQLHFQIIAADGRPVADTAIADIEAVLQRLFRFAGYRLIGRAFIAGMRGTETSQQVAGEGGPYIVRARIQEVRKRGDSGSVTVVVAFVVARDGSVMETTVTLPAGHTAVLGNVKGSGQETLILTVRPELVELSS